MISGAKLCLRNAWLHPPLHNGPHLRFYLYLTASRSTFHFSLFILNYHFSFFTFTFSSCAPFHRVHLYMTASIQQQLAITTDFISLSIFMSLSLVLNQGSQEHHFQNSFEQNKSFLERLFVSERVHSSTKLNVPGNLLTILSQSRSP